MSESGADHFFSFFFQYNSAPASHTWRLTMFENVTMESEVASFSCSLWLNESDRLFIALFRQIYLLDRVVRRQETGGCKALAESSDQIQELEK